MCFSFYLVDALRYGSLARLRGALYVGANPSASDVLRKGTLQRMDCSPTLGGW